MKATKKQSRRKIFRFTLILGNVSDLTPAISDALFEAGCDDALLGMRNGRIFLDFDRRAGSFLEALKSAFADVERAGIGAEIVRVEPID